MFSRYAIFPWLWTALVAVLCGLPGNTFPDLSFWKLIEFDSVAHAFVFAVFSFLWLTALFKQRTAVVMRFGGWPVCIAGVGYGMLIEIMQYLVFVRRSAEWTDMLADAIGSAIGVLVFYRVYGAVVKELRPG